MAKGKGMNVGVINEEMGIDFRNGKKMLGFSEPRDQLCNPHRSGNEI